MLEAWDEDYDGHSASITSLHREGRALRVALSSGSNLAALAQLAICARADFVKNEGNANFFNLSCTKSYAISVTTLITDTETAKNMV